jgi:uncharacterized membrane protein YdjX (TVP38/TMEM64 family)
VLAADIVFVSPSMLSHPCPSLIVFGFLALCICLCPAVCYALLKYQGELTIEYMSQSGTSFPAVPLAAFFTKRTSEWFARLIISTLTASSFGFMVAFQQYIKWLELDHIPREMEAPPSTHI